jgi:hypothetical protein
MLELIIYPWQFQLCFPQIMMTLGPIFQKHSLKDSHCLSFCHQVATIQQNKHWVYLNHYAAQCLGSTIFPSQTSGSALDS